MKRNDGGIEPCTAQFYLGGGLGADLYTPSTLSSLYIVCLLSRPVQAQQQSVRPQQSQSQQQEQQQSEQPISFEQQHQSSSSAIATASVQQPQQQPQQQQRPVAPRQSKLHNITNNNNSNNINNNDYSNNNTNSNEDRMAEHPVLLTHPSSSSIPLRAPWQQVHVAPINNKKDSKSNTTMDYVKQSMRLFQTTAEPSRQSNMSVDALLS